MGMRSDMLGVCDDAVPDVTTRAMSDVCGYAEPDVMESAVSDVNGDAVPDVMTDAMLGIDGDDMSGEKMYAMHSGRVKLVVLVVILRCSSPASRNMLLTVSPSLGRWKSLAGWKTAEGVDEDSPRQGYGAGVEDDMLWEPG